MSKTSAFDDQFIETKLVNGESEFGLKEEYISIPKAEYDTLRESATETGRWATFFIVSVVIFAVMLGGFALVANSLNNEIQYLKQQIEMLK